METKVKLPVGESNIKVDLNEPILPTETPEEKLARETREEAERIANLKPGDEGYVEPTKTEVDTTEEVVIELVGEDGTTLSYKLDKDGNALDDKNTIVYTAEQLKEFGDAPAQEDQLTQISKISGIQPLNTDGTPKVYENTIDGFAQRELDIKNLALVEGQQQGINAFFDANPELRDMYNYKRTFGTLDNYTSFIDYNKIVINSDNKEVNVDLIYKAEVLKGNTPERARRIANYSVQDDTLVNDATEALSYLKDRQAKEVKSVEDQNKSLLAAEIKKQNEYFGVGYDENNKEVILNVKDSIYDIVVTRGEVGNITIPKDGLIVKTTDGTSKHYTRKQIFDYISVPVKEIGGELYTQAQLDEYSRLANKTELVGSYIKNLLGNDISQLVEASKRKENVAVSRRLVVTSGKGVSRGGEAGKGKVIIPIGK